MRAIEGEVFDVAVDLRRASYTFGQWEAVILSAEKQNQFYVPPGFANGFLVISDSATIAYKCTELYHPEDEGGLAWNDPAIAIAWPDLGTSPLLSAKDLTQPAFKSDATYF
ncbi:hypothetical protein MASR2M78_15700 [Treponema sp.]